MKFRTFLNKTYKVRLNVIKPYLDLINTFVPYLERF
jgi:hypothetical protein